jgi:hypothetical protein
VAPVRWLRGWGAWRGPVSPLPLPPPSAAARPALERPPTYPHLRKNSAACGGVYLPTPLGSEGRKVFRWVLYIDLPLEKGMQPCGRRRPMHGTGRHSSPSICGNKAHAAAASVTCCSVLATSRATSVTSPRSNLCSCDAKPSRHLLPIARHAAAASACAGWAPRPAAALPRL